MIIFDGTYRLRPARSMQTAAAWHLRVFDFSKDRPEIRYVRPYAVVAIQTGDEIFKASCAESLGRSICRDFNLVVEKVLWVERFDPNGEDFYVAIFSARERYSSGFHYQIDWRPIQSNEMAMLEPFL